MLQYMHGGNDTKMDDKTIDAQNLHHETQQADGKLETDDKMDAQTLHYEIYYVNHEIEISAEIETLDEIAINDEMDQPIKNLHRHDTRQGDQ